MAEKIRVLFYSNKKKIETFGTVMSEIHGCRCESIPPAYPCDNEKLVLFGVSAKKELPDKVRQFCNELTPQRARNVALFFDGPDSLANEAIELIKAAGARVVGEVFYVDGGFLPFLKNISPEEKNACEMWAYKMLSLSK